jgi:flagellar protein FliJ
METPFRFGLQRVRDLRAHDEERAKEQFAASLSQRLRGEALLRAAEERLQTARADGIGADPPDAGSSMPLSGADLVSRQAWVERLERTKADAEVRLRGLDAELELRRAGLADASRRREVLDKLKDRQRDAHRRDAARRESVLLDEMALGVHRRRAA